MQDWQEDLRCFVGRCQDALADPVLNLERGVAGTLDCKVPVVNGAYGAIKKMVSVIEVYQDDKRLWCGRVLNQTLDWDNSKVLIVEGVLNFLNDSVMPPHTNLDEVSPSAPSYSARMTRITSIEDRKSVV